MYTVPLFQSGVSILCESSKQKKEKKMEMSRVAVEFTPALGALTFSFARLPGRVLDIKYTS